MLIFKQVVVFGSPVVVCRIKQAFSLMFERNSMIISIFAWKFQNIKDMAVNIEKWVIAQKKHKLSDKHVQMARELGLNPDKLGKIDNHQQETWKAPLPQFIEEIYFKRFKREEPETVRPLKEIIALDKVKKEKKKKEKAQKRALKVQEEGNITSSKDIV